MERRPKEKRTQFPVSKKIESGDDLLSRAVASQVPSACGGLTSVFGMGTGGTLQLLSPETFLIRFFWSASRFLLFLRFWLVAFVLS